jgi:hypothetical protein
MRKKCDKFRYCFDQTFLATSWYRVFMYKLLRYVGGGWEVTANSNAPQAVTAARISELSPSSAKYLHNKLPPAENPAAY